jgi:hypothetical protein
MKRICRIPVLGKVLIAVAAICASTQSARADLYLTVSELQGITVVNTQSYDISGTSGSGNTGNTFGGFTISYSVSQPSTFNSQSVLLTSTISSSGSATAAFSMSLSSTIGGSPTNATTGLFTAPGSAGAHLGLSSSLTEISSSGFTGSITNQAGFTSYNGTVVGGVQTVTDSGETLTGVGTASTNPTQLTQVGSTFNLSAMTVEIGTVTAGSSTSFSAEATVALPEPSGMIAAMAGLPCMGLLLGMVHRRKSSGLVASAV